MGLLQKAVETYDAMSHWAGVAREKHSTLLPVSHIMQKAQIEITLDRNGAFIKAEKISKEDEKTVIPATEKSGGRAGKVISPHPLSDQLDYISGCNPEKYDEYIRQLGKWVHSDYAHPKVKAVYGYLKEKRILKDLQTSGLIKLDAAGKLENEKIAGTEYEKCLVRWRILGTGDTDEAWKDLSLIQCYLEYYDSQMENAEKKLCMITGEHDYMSSNHPKGITASNYGAKLISANDQSGFTYRGRFSEAWQAASVGYHASQKAHNALQWVIADQGVVFGGRTFVCWNPKGYHVHQALNLLGFVREKKLNPTEYQKELGRTLAGLRNELPRQEGVVIAAFDAATTGRLSLTYYNELMGSDFYDRIQRWYETCAWDKGLYGVQSPSLRGIVLRTFGTENSNGDLEVDDRVMKEQIQRLFACVMGKLRVPYDIVNALVHRASNPLAYSGNNRMAILFTACALARKYYNDKYNKEVWSMEFEPKRKDRSYQYGCLLAVMEKVERDTYEKDDSREPNAIRMQSVFCQKPLHTARILNERLEPYFSKLKPSRRAFYKKRIGEIIECIAECETGRDNAPLGDTYLMGYYLQRQDLYKAVNKEECEDK